MNENLIWLVTLVVVVAFVGQMQNNMRKRPKTMQNNMGRSHKVTHESLYIPAVFPPYALAMRWPEEPQQLHEDR
jgi:DNA-binding transcriptional regulator LsrR (DeoR family)